MLKLFEALPPLVSIISVPILIIGLIIILYYVLRPNQSRDYVGYLLTTVEKMIDFIEKGEYDKKSIRYLSNMTRRAMYYCDCLESGDMYELEGVIGTVQKINKIMKAISIAKISYNDLDEYMPRVLEQLVHIREVLNNFNIRNKDELFNINALGFSPKKKRQKAKDYLDDIK